MAGDGVVSHCCSLAARTNVSAMCCERLYLCASRQQPWQQCSARHSPASKTAAAHRSSNLLPLGNFNVIGLHSQSTLQPTDARLPAAGCLCSSSKCKRAQCSRRAQITVLCLLHHLQTQLRGSQAHKSPASKAVHVDMVAVLSALLAERDLPARPYK